MLHRIPLRPVLAATCALALTGCGGGRSAVPASTSSGDLPPAVAAAVPAHVTPSRVQRGRDGCYFYRVGTSDLGYDAPLVSDNGTPVCD